jgi:hypothetical protein
METKKPSADQPTAQNKPAFTPAKVGRPTKYKPEMCDQVIEMMAEGASKTEVAACLGINRETLNRWSKEIDEFSNAVKNGELLSQAWWEKEGRVSLRDKDFNATLWYMNMKNRHGWTDKVEKKQTGSIKISWEYPDVIDVTPEQPALTEGECTDVEPST